MEENTQKSVSELEEEGCCQEEVEEYVKRADMLRINPESDEEIKLKIERKAEMASLKLAVSSDLFKKRYSEASEKLADFIEKYNYIYVTKEDKANEYWIYHEGIYTPNGKSFIKEELREILGEYYSSWILTQVLPKIEADNFIEPENFFNNEYPYEIVVENGILNIITRELSKYDPNKIFFTKIPVKYYPSARCEKIHEFLEQVLASPEDKKVFFELAGFGLLKDYRFEKAFMFVGDGRNGKGKSIELLKRLVGAENCASLSLTSLIPDSFCVSQLFGKLFNLAGDLSSSALKDTGMFKMLTGRDIISANRKHLNHLTFKNYAKFVFACNELPKVYDYSTGFWSRWVLLEFPYTFVHKDEYESAKNNDLLKIRDTDIIEKITKKGEMSGFLNEALEGLKRILENSGFSYTIGTEEIKNTWIRRADSFMAFCMDNVTEDYEENISKKKLRKIYSIYCKKHKVKGASDKAIKATLQEMFGASEEYITNEKGHREWVWDGIKLKFDLKKGQL